MKNKNNFRGLFWVGIVPISIIALLILMILTGVLYTVTKSPSQGSDESVTLKETHICPKKEIVYIHDTVRIKVPQACHREHVSLDAKPPVSQESLKGINDTNNTDRIN